MTGGGRGTSVIRQNCPRDLGSSASFPCHLLDGLQSLASEVTLFGELSVVELCTEATSLWKSSSGHAATVDNGVISDHTGGWRFHLSKTGALPGAD